MTMNDFLSGEIGNCSKAPAWFCVRTHSKHEHIAAAGLRQELGLEIFLPRVSVRRATIRGVVRFTEALFPNYLFARFLFSDQLQAVRHARGVSQVVHFGSRWPTLPHAAIQELQALVHAAELEAVQPVFLPGQPVTLSGGVFHGLTAVILRALPGRDRVAVLLDFLGQQTTVEVSTRELVKAQL
jgi:transcriptional antiterminator RfaH